MPTYSCGCINEVDADSGVLRCVKKCDDHIRFLACQNQDSYEFYQSLGCFKDHIPQNKRYIVEFKDAFSELNALMHGGYRHVLEIGCGVGMYIPMFISKGWEYEGIETSNFAALYAHNTHDVLIHTEPFELFDNPADYDVILAAHVVEHMNRAPKMLRKMYDLLNNNGVLYVIVPDDSDPVNPDHKFFFTPGTLYALLQKIGFRNIRSTTRQIIEREKFIYCAAEK